MRDTPATFDPALDDDFEPVDYGPAAPVARAAYYAALETGSTCAA